jgi:23S rRNA pseudouridine2605 synthase
MRLAKYLASAGVASRRKAEELISAGLVTVDGATVTDPATDVDEGRTITVEGRTIQDQPRRVVYALNKPPGVVSTARDPQGRPTVVDLIGSDVRLYPVGRLDIDTTGLILLTNDGPLAHRLTHPSFEVTKTYRALLARAPIKEPALGKLRRGVLLDDGPTAPAVVNRISPDTIEITIHEGRNRQVKRMCDAVGHPVRRLQRVRFGPLELGSLKLGTYKRLSAADVERLTAAATARRRADSWSSASSRSRRASPRPDEPRPGASR